MTYSVCVFCGARPGKDPDFERAATTLGVELARHEMRLVYGAGDVGIMGAVARATQDAGGQTFGVIPAHLVAAEVAKTDLTRYIVTEDMHERKKVMYMNSDAILVLPGGAGSMDEFFEVLTWAQLGRHTKPIIIVNLKGYWDPLIALLDHIVENGFADPSIKGLFSVVATVNDAINALSKSSA